MSKFNIGDNVKILKKPAVTGFTGPVTHNVGDVGVVEDIIDINGTPVIGVRCHDVIYYYFQEDLEKGHYEWVKED